MFERAKLANSIRRSVGKFFKSEAELEEIIDAVEDRAHSLGESEIESRLIGEFVLDELAKRVTKSHMCALLAYFKVQDVG